MKNGRQPIGARRFALAVGLLGLLLLAGLGIVWFGQYPPFAPSLVSAGREPMIFVAPFDDDGGANDALTRGFTREVIVELSRFDDLSVFGPETSFSYGMDPEPHQEGRAPPVDLLVTGGLTISGNQFRVVASLVDAKTGRNLWSDVIKYDLTAADIFQVRELVAGQLAQALAQRHGILLRRGKPFQFTELAF